MGNIRCAKGIRLGTALLGLSLFLRPLPLQAEYAEGMEAYRKAWAAYATQSYDEAKRWAERAVRADPENAHAHALLGNLAYLRHDLAEAKGSWQKAMGLNSQLNLLQGRIAQAELELGLENQLKPAGLGALTLRLPANLTPEERAEILQNLSQAMEKLEPYFKYRPERPLTVLIYPHEQFYASTHLPTEVLGLFDGKIRVPHQSDLG
ncbi:MAG: hypothetical protein HYZ90_06615, partial [Candidatus Omnitrophica bacterium]|nr:hypothetical protein [Candidatus Omnitrophota bacterium]